VLLEYAVIGKNSYSPEDLTTEQRAIMNKCFYQHKIERMANHNNSFKLDEDELVRISSGSKPPLNWKSHPCGRFMSYEIENDIIEIYRRRLNQTASTEDHMRWIDWKISMSNKCLPTHLANSRIEYLNLIREIPFFYESERY